MWRLTDGARWALFGILVIVDFPSRWFSGRFGAEVVKEYWDGILRAVLHDIWTLVLLNTYLPIIKITRNYPNLGRRQTFGSIYQCEHWRFTRVFSHKFYSIGHSSRAGQDHFAIGDSYLSRDPLLDELNEFMISCTSARIQRDRWGACSAQNSHQL